MSIDDKYIHNPCGGEVYAEEWATQIVGVCKGCGKRWQVLDPMNDVINSRTKEPRRWLFGPMWAEVSNEL